MACAIFLENFVRGCQVTFFFLCWKLFQVLLYGGQVVSWRNERREQLLYMSSKVNSYMLIEMNDQSISFLS